MMQSRFAFCLPQPPGSFYLAPLAGAGAACLHSALQIWQQLVVEGEIEAEASRIGIFFDTRS